MKAKKRESRKPGVVDAKKTEPKAARPELWLIGLGLLAGLFVAFQAYAPALNGPFLFDDVYLPMNDPGWVNGPLSSWVGRVRPLLMFTYWLNYRSAGLNTGPYHEWNLVFHFLNALLVSLIVRKLLRMAERPSNELALFAGALFLLHPVQTEAVAYIAGRSDDLSSLFLFAAFALFLYRRQAAVSWPVALGVLALFAFAAASKENTVVLPALLLATDYFWNPGFRFEAIRRNWRLYLPMAIGGLVGALKVVQVLNKAESAGFQMKDLTWYQYLFTQFRVFFVYLQLFLLPSGQTVDYDFPYSRTILDRGAIWGLLGILAMTGAAIYYRRQYRLASYGFFVFLILLAPTSSFIPIRDPISERRLYLPMLGLLLILVEAVAWAERRWRIGRTALSTGLAVVLVIFAALTYRRNIVWSGAIPLWEDAVQKSPGKGRAHFQLGHAYYTANLCEQAGAQYELASKLDPPDYRLLLDWALADNCLDRSGEAIAKLKQANALTRSAHVYSQLAMIYAKTGRIPEALEALDTAEDIDPKFEITYVYRGQIMASQNNLAGAEQQYRRALAINPNNQQARDYLQEIRRQSRQAR